MFEALMPALFVPEDEWGPRSWAINHPLTVAAQIHHGLIDAGYGFWGFSPSNTPEGGYHEYGVDAIAMSPDGYCSNEDHTRAHVQAAGSPGPGEAAGAPASAYANGVVTPHASFLALRWAPDAALANLAKLERNFAIYDRWGFRDSVNVGTGRVSDSYLSLDQGIIMAAIGNALGNDMLRRAFATPRFRKALQPVIAMEEFNVGPRDWGAQLEREWPIGESPRGPPRLGSISADRVHPAGRHGSGAARAGGPSPDSVRDPRRSRLPGARAGSVAARSPSTFDCHRRERSALGS
jgi:Putative glucoamylase